MIISAILDNICRLAVCVTQTLTGRFALFSLSIEATPRDVTGGGLYRPRPVYLHPLHWRVPRPLPPVVGNDLKEGRKEMFYLTTHSTHFIYGYMASDIR